MSKKANKGFTLIELLLVVAIIAALSIIVILALNPAELLRQARDSSRISDMSTLSSALSFYLANYSSPFIGTSSAAFGCYTDVQGLTNGTSSCITALTGPNTAVWSSTTPRANNGLGWIPVDFTKISSGAPLGQLPVDPLGDDQKHMYFYHPSSTSLTFKLAADMESSKYSKDGPKDVEGPDGGPVDTMYETGTALGTW